MFGFAFYGYNLDVPVRTNAVPTRRSSDLPVQRATDSPSSRTMSEPHTGHCAGIAHGAASGGRIPGTTATTSGITSPARRTMTRSEEHTSELQSLMRISSAVVCLNKKKSTLRIIYAQNNNDKHRTYH